MRRKTQLAFRRPRAAIGGQGPASLVLVNAGGGFGERARLGYRRLVIASLGLWIAVGVLSALLIAGAAGLFLLLAMGRLGLDLGWGRSVHQLGPITIRIAAPRDLVFEMIRAPYAGRTPRRSGIEVLARGSGLAVAAHYTKLRFYRARTVEVIEFEPPGRVGFRHLAGPVPHAVEEFTLSEADGDTEIRYGGEVGIDFFALGRVAGRHWVRPQWERVVREHLEDLKTRAEQRARRAEQRARRGSREPGEATRQERADQGS